MKPLACQSIGQDNGAIVLILPLLPVQFSERGKSLCPLFSLAPLTLLPPLFSPIQQVKLMEMDSQSPSIFPCVHKSKFGQIVRRILCELRLSDNYITKTNSQRFLCFGSMMVFKLQSFGANLSLCSGWELTTSRSCSKSYQSK